MTTAPRRPRPTFERHLSGMVALTFATGLVDAVGYLGLDRVFVGNMTGNIVILGMGIAGSEGLPVLGPAVALATFAAAAFVTGMVLRERIRGWSPHVTGCLSVGALILGVCAVVSATANMDDEGWMIGVAAATAAAMGIQACVARKVAVADMTTVVVTSTLTSLAGETWTGGGGWTSVWNRRMTAILSIMIGAAVGALLLRLAHMGFAIGIACLLTAVVALLGHRENSAAIEQS